jgi:uncharacterized membrane protein YphA (DoxX/SURF4 family)
MAACIEKAGSTAEMRRCRNLLPGNTLMTSKAREPERMERIASMAAMDSASRTADDTIRRTLKLVFGLVPIVAGLDKFTDLLVQWDKYLAPPIAHLLPMTPRFFMHLVGIIEIVAGAGVLLTPWTRLFAWIVGLWLLGIALNLIVGGYYDIAVRDIVMAISAFCLAHLSAFGVTRRTFVAPGTAAP